MPDTSAVGAEPFGARARIGGGPTAAGTGPGHGLDAGPAGTGPEPVVGLASAYLPPSQEQQPPPQQPPPPPVFEPRAGGRSDGAAMLPTATAENSFTVSLWPSGQGVGTEDSDIGRVCSKVAPQARQRYS